MAEQFTHKPRILCTEDHPDTREMLAVLLKLEGYDVVWTDSPQDTLNRAQVESFDLFKVDNCLPGMSRLRLTKELREINVTTPTLFYSGLDPIKTKTKRRKPGRRDFWSSRWIATI